MMQNRVKHQRMTQLEELLKIEYEKLNEFEKEIAITASAPAKFELRQSLKRELLPDIRKHEAEYAELLAEEADLSLIPEADARSALVEVVQAVEHIEKIPPADRSDKLTHLLTDIREKLDDPGKAAAAKLKITLPIIPLIASYEMEIDTEGFMIKAWQRVKSLFGGKA